MTAPLNGNVSGTIPVSANANDNVGVVGVQFQLNGSPLQAEDTTSPYSINWDTTTVANGSYTLTAVARDAAGNSTPSSGVTVTVNNSDITFPTVSITAPLAGANLSGTTNVTANANDNVGVVGVQFKLDGVNLGSEDLASPYSVSWNTTSASNGSHTLTATARDAAGNSTPSSGVSVTVNNVSAGITGASLATCPSGCTNGTDTTVTTPHFTYNVPVGLTGTAPVVFVAGGGGNCGSGGGQNYPTWKANSPNALTAHRYIGVGVICPDAASWNQVESTGKTGTSDSGYIATVVSYVCSHTFNGVTPDCPGVTTPTGRLYFTGGSAGGHMTRSVMCSANTQQSFRAVAIMAAGAWSLDGNPNGTNGSTTGAKCQDSAFRNIFAMYIAGDGATGDPALDLGPPWPDFFGFANTITWQAAYFGCNPTPVTTTSTVNGFGVTKKDFSGCNYGSSVDGKRQFHSVISTSNQHSAGLDNDLGAGWIANEDAAFFDSTTN